MREIKYTDYVCNRCFYQLPNCKCDKHIIPTLINVDEKLQYAIRILNQKGWKTKYCCEGHFSKEDGIGQIYIAFDKLSQLPSIPKNWTAEVTESLFIIEYLCGNETDIGNTLGNFNKKQKEAIGQLNIWVDKLEMRKI